VGRNIAKEIVLTGEMISAQRAYEIGLVNRIASRDGLMEDAREIARKILEKAPVALSTAKSVMNRGLDLDLESACALEANAFAVMFSTGDGAEGMTAFLEKRKPAFTGR
jgi:enoyl-CoA hydratase